MGKNYDQKIKVGGENIPLWKRIEDATFPGVQGTPYLNHIAAKAVFFKEMLADEYRTRQFKIVENAKRLAGDLLDLGLDVLTKGTDNHMILVNVANLREGLSGVVAQRCLEECGIVVDFYRLPYDQKPASIGNGIRLGTPIVTRRGMGEKEMDDISAMMDKVLKGVNILGRTQYQIDEKLKNGIRRQVENLCSRFSVSKNSV